MDVTSYIFLFFRIFLYTLGVPVVCGLLVGVCRYLFTLFMGQGFGYGIIMATSVVGTPVHELGHALMCLLFGHKIDRMVLWSPMNKDGNLGYVTHSYHPKNPYHQLGNIFIGLGPVFSGLGIMILCMALCFPETLFGYADTAAEMVTDGESLLSLLGEGVRMVPNLMGEWSNEDVPVWGRVIALIVMLSVSLHISLSPADIKGALGGVPVYLVLTLIATIIVSLLGESAMTATVSALRLFSAAAFALFMLVFVFSLVQLAVGLVVFLIRRILHLR